jgi:hypothetical protein
MVAKGKRTGEKTEGTFSGAAFVDEGGELVATEEAGALLAQAGGGLAETLFAPGGGFHTDPQAGGQLGLQTGMAAMGSEFQATQ